MDNQDGRIGHWAFLQTYTGAHASEFHQVMLLLLAQESQQVCTNSRFVVPATIVPVHFLGCQSLTGHGPNINLSELILVDPEHVRNCCNHRIGSIILYVMTGTTDDTLVTPR